MEKKKEKNADRLYTAHGQKMVQGKLSVINGKKALATFKGEEIVGYTTLEELNTLLASFAQEESRSISENIK